MQTLHTEKSSVSWFYDFRLVNNLPLQAYGRNHVKSTMPLRPPTLNTRISTLPIFIYVRHRRHETLKISLFTPIFNIDPTYNIDIQYIIKINSINEVCHSMLDALKKKEK